MLQGGNDLASQVDFSIAHCVNTIEECLALIGENRTAWLAAQPKNDRLGLVQLAPRENPYLAGMPAYANGAKPFSEETARAIDEEVMKILEDSHKEAIRLLTKHRAALDALVKALLDRESLDESEILQVTGLPPAPPAGKQEAVGTIKWSYDRLRRVVVFGSSNPRSLLVCGSAITAADARPHESWTNRNVAESLTFPR